MARSGRGTITRSTYRPIPRAALYFELLTASLSAAGVNVKSIDTLKSGSLTPASVLLRQFTLVKSIAATIASSGGMLKSSSISVEGSVSSSAALDDIFVIALALVGAISSISGSLDNAPSKYLTAQLDTASALTKSLSRSFSASILSSSAQQKVSQFVIDSYLAPTGSAARTFLAFRSFSGAALPTQTLSKVARKPVGGNITATGTPRRLASKLLAGAISMAATLVRQRVGDIDAISASISIENIISIVMVYEDKSVVLSIDGI